MICSLSILLLVSSLSCSARAENAPEITIIAEGYNLIAKLPCVSCPFLYQDTIDGRDGVWKTREDDNALLLNISLPYDSAYVSINNAALLSSSKVLPQIYANQVLADTSTSDLATLLATDSLDNDNSAALAVSYAYSLHRLSEPSNGFVFQFDIFEAWTDLSESPLTIKLPHPKQKVLEVVLLQRPLFSPGDPSQAYEIVRARLIPRYTKIKTGLHWMNFHDWDAHGEKGTSAHLVSSASDSFLRLITSGVWSLFVFILAIIGLFVVLCLFCIFWCGSAVEYEYEKAQSGKRRAGASDVENVKGRFMTAEELGLRSGARVVGVGKSD